MPSLHSETDLQTNVASLLTPHGRGAVATIAVRGSLEQLNVLAEKSPHSFFLARNKKSIHLQTVGKILFGCWGDEELVVCRSAENEIEIHCHGGEAAISRILSDLEQLGVKVLDWQNYLEQSQNIWGSDYLQAISCARTFRTAELLLHQRQMNPNFWQELSKCQDSHYWAQLDDETQLNHRNTIQQMQQWSEFGKHLASPWNIVIGGLPNVGKSSLINAILGYKRAIVVDQPGTTRDVVTGETAIDGWPVLLSDTAGQRETGDVLESAGIERAIQAMQKADLQILLLDRATAPDQQNQILMSKFPESLLVFNKIDIEADPNWNNIEFQIKPLEVSCETGQGIESLIQSIMQKLIPQLPPENLVLPVTSRQQQLLSKLMPLIQ